jgi:hypothetical protein
MVMQQNKIKRRMYTSPEALNSITARTRPKSIYDAPTRPKPPSARGGATMDPPGSSIGFERTGTATQPVGDRFGDAVKAGRVSAGTPVQQRVAPETPRPMVRPTNVRAGVQRSAQPGPTTRQELRSSQGMLPFGVTQYDYRLPTGPDLSALYGQNIPEVSVGPFSLVQPRATTGDLSLADSGFPDLGEGLDTARMLANQIKAQQGSEAARSFTAPLDQSEADDEQPQNIFDPEGELIYSNPEAPQAPATEEEETGTGQRELSEEERKRYAKEEAKIRLSMSWKEKARGEDDGVTGDARDAYEERYGENDEIIGELVSNGFTTYQEALWLLENGMYIDRNGVVKRAAGTDVDDDPVVLDLQPQNKSGREIDHKQLAAVLGIDPLSDEQLTGTYDPKYGATGLQGQTGDAAGGGEVGEYGFAKGSVEDQIMSAVLEGETPQHSVGDIEDRKRKIAAANRGAYMNALRMAAYQNQASGGSPDALMATQADLARQIGQQTAQQQVAAELQMQDQNYRASIVDTQRKADALMQIAMMHREDELGEVAFTRAQSMARLNQSLQKDYAQWADENLGPKWYESLAGGLGQTAGQVGGGLAFLKLAAMMGLGGSDKRLKKNIRKANISPFKRNGYKPDAYTWEWNDIAKKLYGYVGSSFGVIAQEIEKVIPEAVSVDENGYRVVNYAMLQEA